MASIFAVFIQMVWSLDVAWTYECNIPSNFGGQAKIVKKNK